MADEPDADVRALLDRLAEMDAPPIHELDPAAARELSGLPTGDPDVELGGVEDRTVPGPAGEIPVRVYAPTGDGPHPVVLFYHGGGFVLGDLDGHDAPCRILAAESEAVVVSVDYRLAPEHPFPAAVEDASAALSWVADNADELDADADPERLAVAGDSAGGNLAAVVALAARDRDGPEIAHQALFYPVVDFRSDADYDSVAENAEGYFLTRDDMAYFHGHYVPSWADEPNPYCSPLLAPSHADLPPATVVTCGFDPLRDEGRAYAAALDDAGVPVAHRHYEGLIHGVINMAVEPMDVAGGHDVLADVAADLREALA